MKNKILANPGTNFIKCLDDLTSLFQQTKEEDRRRTLKEIDELTKEVSQSDDYFTENLIDDDGNTAKEAVFRLERIGDESSTRFTAKLLKDPNPSTASRGRGKRLKPGQASGQKAGGKTPND
jgi:flagellar motor component MotA